MNNEIPKIIHYCWFGNGEYSHLVQKCIESWKKVLPDYQFYLWNENNFDVYSLNYTKEAYEEKKYAFVADYVRLYALYEHGGIYLDTDMEVIKPIDKFLNESSFVGFGADDCLDVGIIGSTKGNVYIGELKNKIENMNLKNSNGEMNQTIIGMLNELMIKEGFTLNNTIQFNENITIYPTDVFCPKQFYSFHSNINSETCTIHHYDGSWLTKKQRRKNFYMKLLKSTKKEYIKYFGEESFIKIKGILKK